MKADRHGMVQMKAKGTWTINSPTNSAIIHGDDRKGADPLAQYPYVTPADAEHLESRGLAEVYEGSVPSGEGSGEETVDERAGRAVEENADAENSVEDTTGLSTRDTTAHSQPVHELAGSSAGRALNVASKGGDAGSDEAPSGGKAKAKAPAGEK